jgi:hypothetical protein
MNEPPSPEDPIWSRWRERHGRPSAPSDRPTEEGGNGTQGDERASAEGERIRFGEPLGPDWDRPREEAASEPHAHVDRECLEWCPICRTADVVRATLPPELRSQLESVQRDALVAMRALLDHYIERLDGRDPPSSRVEDIPIA